ncbi:hypothetical protein CTAYLR_007602 [Chrysophaeum taylorii]|uniref:Kinesin motor domain-containing protein n=1 Tax=Chrysophaeum taylorii TaxID=2483200 RepID=A0AAD7U699_9STRA|nr:hypothetical protein CTAYLR_007602 [Chrysophaeum taylorii]
MMPSTEYLCAVVANIAIRDQPGSVDCVGNLGKGDGVRLRHAVSEVPEWAEISLLGAVRAPGEVGVVRPSWGFVRTFNRGAQLLVAWDDESAARAAVDAQAAEREAGTSWFRSATRTPATATQHATPLLQGGAEEYERRSALHRALAAAAAAGHGDPRGIRDTVDRVFDGAEWARALLRDDKRVAYAISALCDAKTKRPLQHSNTPPKKTQPRIFCKERGGGRRRRVASRLLLLSVVPLASPEPSELPLRRLLDSEGAFAELWVRLPWACRPAAAATCRALALAVRRVPWRRLCAALCDEADILCCDLALELPRDDSEWRRLFVDLWTTRRREADGEDDDEAKKKAFSIEAVVRFRPSRRPPASEAAMFLPLHQQLQLRKMGHDAGLRREVDKRIKGSDEDVVLVGSRRRRRPKSDDDDDDADSPEEKAKKEKSAAHARVVSTERTRVLVGLPASGLVYMDYDRVLGPAATQAETYAVAALPLVRAFCAGYDACLLAYGQTAAGKSHCMVGPPGALQETAASAGFRKLSASAGVVPRAIRDVLDTVAAGRVDASLTVSYLELYQEKLTDLFTGNPVSLYRVGRGVGADEYRRQKTGDETLALGGCTALDATKEGPGRTWEALVGAEHRKHLAATAMNSRSSRAHSIVALSLTKRGRRGQLVSSKLYLVDLGGSEQIKKSVTADVAKMRVREAIEINASLTALGRVVDALAARNKHHVPYYESRLTTLLRPAFGGNSKTVVLVAASSDDADAEETVASLRFGLRCARVQNSSGKAPTADMRAVLASLEADMAKAKETIALLEAKGAKAQAEIETSDAKLRAVGTRVASRLHDDDAGGDVAREAHLVGQGDYSYVHDDAGLWLVETRRLAALEARYKDILGQGGGATT